MRLLRLGGVAVVGCEPTTATWVRFIVETRYGFAVLAHQDDGRPRCVDDHEDDRQGNGHRVRRVRRGAPRDRGYDHRPRRVAREALVRGGCAGYPSNAA